MISSSSLDPPESWTGLGEQLSAITCATRRVWPHRRETSFGLAEQDGTQLTIDAKRTWVQTVQHASGMAGHGGNPVCREMLALRRRLLRQPLGLDFTDAELEAEASQIHLALWHDGAIAGTLLLVTPDATGTAKLRQMAIEPRLQRQHLGTFLVVSGEDELRRLGAATASLAARSTAVRFYERLGYQARGEPYIDLTIAHLHMEKRLDTVRG